LEELTDCSESIETLTLAVAAWPLESIEEERPNYGGLTDSEEEELSDSESDSEDSNSFHEPDPLEHIS
jgi:hypothetical protein